MSFLTKLTHEVIPRNNNDPNVTAVTSPSGTKVCKSHHYPIMIISSSLKRIFPQHEREVVMRANTNQTRNNLFSQ